jgi:hypothetical protein
MIATLVSVIDLFFTHFITLTRYRLTGWSPLQTGWLASMYYNINCTNCKLSGQNILQTSQQLLYPLVIG